MKATRTARDVRQPSYTLLSLLTLLLMASPAALAAPSATEVQMGMMHQHVPDFGATPTVRSVISGSWSSPSTWDTGTVPGAGARVSIQPNHVVTYDRVNSAVLDVVRVEYGGTLRFATDRNTSVTVVTLLAKGTLEIGTESNPVDPAVKAEIIIADTPIDLTTDPGQMGHGVIGPGVVTFHGAPKSPTFVQVAQEPLAGDTVLVLASAPTGWRAGDRLVLPDTRQLTYAQVDSIFGYNEFNPIPVPDVSSMQWEELIIASVAGNRVTLTQPLRFNHHGARDASGTVRALPHVMNMTRNIVIRSANPDGVRGHTLMMHRAEYDSRYVLYQGLGRSTTALLDSTTFDAQGNATHIGTNQIARYPAHVHHLLGPSNPGPNRQYQAVFIGNAIDGMPAKQSAPFFGAPKWSLVWHGTSFGLIKWNTIYDGVGSGVVTENGSETQNLFEENMVARIIGNGERIGKNINEGEPGNFGNEGSGFWFAGINNYVRGNVVANARQQGYASVVSSACVPAWPGADPSIASQCIEKRSKFVTPESNNPCNSDAMMFLDFANNTAYASQFGVDFWRLAPGCENLIESPVIWHTSKEAVHVQYANKVGVDNALILGDPDVLAADPQIPKRSQPAGIVETIGYDHFLRVGNSTIHNTYVGIWPALRGNTLTGLDLANHINVHASGCSGGTGCGSVPVDLTVRDTAFKTPSFANQRSSYPFYAIQMSYTDVFQSTPYTFRVYDSTFSGVPSPGIQVYFNEQGTQNVAGGLAPCTTKRPDIDGIVCPANDTSPANQPPVVDAFPDQTIPLSGTAILNANISDDGLPNPPGRVTVAWSMVNGPGLVTFSDPAGTVTSATFSVAGVYVLRATASDSARIASDDVTITVTPPGPNPNTCTGDVNGDGAVNVLDLILIARDFGLSGSPADVNGNGVVDIFDLVAAASAFGVCQ